MSEPPVLNYNSPSSTPPLPTPRYFARAFWIGVGISAVAWIALGTGAADINSLAVLLVLVVAVPGLKLLVGIIFLCFRQYRSAGAGLLASLPVGAAIFFSVCAMS